MFVDQFKHADDSGSAKRRIEQCKYRQLDNGFSPKIVRKSPDLRIFTEIRILRLHLSDFDDIFTIGSVFAFRARCRTPFPADFAKNAVSENFDCQMFRNFLKKNRISFEILRSIYGRKTDTDGRRKVA